MVTRFIVVSTPFGERHFRVVPFGEHLTDRDGYPICQNCGEVDRLIYLITIRQLLLWGGARVSAYCECAACGDLSVYSFYERD